MRKILVCISLLFSVSICQGSSVSLVPFMNKYKDASLAIYHALEHCRKTQADTLVFNDAVYHCYPDKALQQFINISNNENGPKRIALPLIDQHNFVIDGRGASIILHGLMMGSIIHRSSNIKIVNLSFDWDIPFYVQGKVTEVNKSNQSFNLQFAPYVKYRVANNDILFDMFGKEYMISSNFWFDPESGFPVYNLTKRMLKKWNAHLPDHYQITDKGNGNILVENVKEQLPEKGWNMIAKWRHPDYRINRAAPSIHIFNAKNITLQEVFIYSAAGMGVIGERSENITLNKVKVTPTPDSDRIVSVTADATHFVNCKGQVTLQDCIFESQLDDGCNIHGCYAEFERMIDSHTLAAKVVHRQQVGFQFAQAGDTIQFIARGTLMPVAQKFVVKDVRYFNESYFEITTAEPLKNVPDSAGLENISWVADFTMTGCTVKKNWARSVLFKTPGKVVITDNSFSSSMSGARNWGEMNWFYESGNVKDVLISNNEFIDNCRVGTGMPVIVIRPQVKKGLKDVWYNRNIRITNNLIKTFDSAILEAYSTNGLIFSGNKIIQTNTYNPLYPDLPVIQIENCNAVEIKNNEYKGSKKANIVIDSLSKEESIIKGNQGFE